MVEPFAASSGRRPSDEMTLAELWLIVWTRKRVVAAITALFALAGIALAFTMPPQHRFTTVIEIGNQVVNEEVVPVEALNTVIAKLQDSYIPATIIKFNKDAAVPSKDYAFKAAGSRQSQIVTITSEAPRKDASVQLTLHARIAEALVKDHSRMIDTVHGNAAMLLVKAEGNLAQLEARETATAEQIELLNRAIAETQKRSDGVSKHIAQLNEQLSALKGRTDSSSTTQAILLFQQIGALATLDADLSEKAGLRLRVERSNAQARLVAIARNKETARRAIRYRQTAQKNIQATRIVGGEAIMSSRPVAPNKLVISLVSLIVGAVAAIGVALALDFFSKARATSQAGKP